MAADTLVLCAGSEHARVVLSAHIVLRKLKIVAKRTDMSAATSVSRPPMHLRHGKLQYTVKSEWSQLSKHVAFCGKAANNFHSYLISLFVFDLPVFEMVSAKRVPFANLYIIIHHVHTLHKEYKWLDVDDT